jgi:hypothetical protein
MRVLRFGRGRPANGGFLRFLYSRIRMYAAFRFSKSTIFWRGPT